jgi:serine/threonine protein kinase
MSSAERPMNDRPTETNLPPLEGSLLRSAQVATLGGGEPLPPRPLPVIAGYQVVRRLGGGGMGEVYEVVDEKVAVRLALKTIRPDRVGGDFLARFRREVRAMMLLDHPHIARIYGHGETDGAPFFTMKFFSGGALSERRDELQAKPRQAVELVLKVAEAVEYLHRQGQVHRDLKLSNILLDEAAEPHLSDFGLVKEGGPLAADEAQGEPAANEPDEVTPDAETKADSGPARGTPDDNPTPSHVLTRTGHVLGTYAYMSPEQTRGEWERVGPQSDLWGLGVILYELLAGRQPFSAGQAGEMVRRIREEPPPPPTSFGERRDVRLDAIVLRCMAKEPAQRYESAAALATDLRGWLDRDRPAKKPRWVLWLAAAAAVVFLGMSAAALLYRPKPEVKTPEPEVQTAAERLLEAQAQLERGEEVQWIGKHGMPLWYRIQVGKETAHVRSSEWDNTFTVDTQTEALVELCPDPMCDRYHVEALVRQNMMNNGNPRVGLFFLHQTRGADEGQHLFADWSFNEKLSPEAWSKGHEPAQGKRAGRARFYVTYFRDQLPLRPNETPHARALELTSNERNDANEEWRLLAVDVTPSLVQIWFDGKLVDKIPRKNVDNFAGGAVGHIGTPEPMSARSGFGVIVSSSSASFKSMFVRRLTVD